MRRASLKDILTSVLPNALRSAVFLTSNACAIISLSCISRHIAGASYLALSPTIPAFFASLGAIFIERKSRRSELAMYIMSQAAWCIWRLGVQQGWLVNLPAGDVLLWCLAMAAVMFTFATQPASVHGAPKSVLSFLVKPKQCDPAAPAPEVNNDWVRKRLVSTLTTAVRAFGTGWALQAAIALVRVLISGKIKAKSLLGALVGSPQLRLGSFFGGTAGLYWLVRHGLHALRKTDDGVNSALAGFAAGLPMAVMRSPTLALYLAAKASEVSTEAPIHSYQPPPITQSIFWIAVSKGLVTPIPHGDSLVYAISGALMMMLSAKLTQHIKSAFCLAFVL